MQVPMETLVIDLLKPENQNVDKATGISALQFEPSIGTRFMCGLENGIINLDRMICRTNYIDM